MTKAIFLDRDGVINQERKDYVKKLDEFRILDKTSDAINIIKNRGFLVIIITNQSAISRKLLSVETLNKIHEKLQSYLEKYGTSFDGIYFCPHMPSENCECRKPKPGLIVQAVTDFQIDLSQSYMIGNSETDVQAATNAGCKGILLKENQTLLETVVDLFESEKI
tara:strand:+ start:301 stop:795 length:495 start_codon:yes stop_codon:yes gene_type:complete